MCLNSYLCCWPRHPPHPESAWHSQMREQGQRVAPHRGAGGAECSSADSIRGPCLIQPQQPRLGSFLPRTSRTHLTSPSGNPLTVIYVGCELQETATEYIAQCLGIQACKHESHSPVFPCDPEHGARPTVDPSLLLQEEKTETRATSRKPRIRSMAGWKHYHMLNCAPITTNAPGSPLWGTETLMAIITFGRPCSVIL